MTDTAVVDGSQTELVRFWKNEIELSERTTDKFCKAGDKIYKRYRDVRTPREEAATRFNVLWSNVQTRLPALYARNPKPVVEQRHKDGDKVARSVAEVLERSLEYTLSHCNDYYSTNRNAVTDFELPGLGCVWVRYVPHFHKEQSVTGSDKKDVKAEGVEETNEAEDPADESLKYEETKVDYVYWKDFGWTWARTWDEVRAVWRKVYLTKDELAERFDLSPAEADKVPLDYQPKQANQAKVSLIKKKAIVYEIWDKQTRKAIWLVKNYERELDVRDDPLKLLDFFPCPRPLLANTVNDELTPNPNFKFYQDQANEIDELSTRISAITKALKVAGVRDSSAEGLDRLLSEGVENALVPVDGWNRLKEAGGLKGAYELLPLEEIAKALGYLREQRQMLIEDVFQITGMSDIIRGFTDPNETATAQQIKGNFGILRIQDAQAEVQRFCRDTVRIVAQVVADYDIETLKQISGVKLLTAAEKQAAQMLKQLTAQAPGAGAAPPGAQPTPQAASGQPGASPPPVAVDPQKAAILDKPTWEEVEELLKNPVMRDFVIDIETDSTIRMDEDAERASRLEFLNTAGAFLEKAVTAGGQVPAIAPLLGEMLMFGVRSFRQSRSLEQAFETAMHTLETQAPAPKPDPEVLKVQAQVQGQKEIAQVKAATDLKIAQGQQAAQAQEDKLRSQFEAERSIKEQAVKSEHEKQITDLKQHFESERVQYETQAKKEIADKDNETKIHIELLKQKHEKELKAQDQDHERKVLAMTHEHEQKMGVHQAESAEKIADKKAKQKPKAN